MGEIRLKADATGDLSSAVAFLLELSNQSM